MIQTAWRWWCRIWGWLGAAFVLYLLLTAACDARY
jgi:hypothetical protein